MDLLAGLLLIIHTLLRLKSNIIFLLLIKILFFRYYLFLQAGYTKESLAEAMSAIPQGIEEEDEEDEEEQVSYFKKRADLKRQKDGKTKYKSKDWILNKKEKQKRQGKDIRENSKYTGRKRTGRGVY